MGGGEKRSQKITVESSLLGEVCGPAVCGHRVGGPLGRAGAGLGNLAGVTPTQRSPLLVTLGTTSCSKW